MLPLKIKPYVINIHEEIDDGNSIIEGELSCCEKQEFEITYDGLIKKSFLMGTYLYSDDNKLVLEAKCKHCGRKILIFDSSIDGFSNCEKKPNRNVSRLKSFDCKKCNTNNYTVKIKYEYSDVQELIEEGIENIDNAYSWIWVALKCNECNSEYRKLIDFETA